MIINHSKNKCSCKFRTSNSISTSICVQDIKGKEQQHSCVLSNISNAQSSVVFEVLDFIPVFMKYYFFFAQDIT